MLIGYGPAFPAFLADQDWIADLPYLPDVIYLAYRVDLHRTRAALRLKDALVEHGRCLGSDTESQQIAQEITTGYVPR